MSDNLKPFQMFEAGTQVYKKYTEGDTVTFRNSIWTAGAKLRLGRRPDESGSGWTRSQSGDITGIGITASAGLTGTKRTVDGFHYQTITVATGGITTAHIADNAITSSKIADGAILGVDVANGITLTNPDATGDVEVFGDVYITGTAADGGDLGEIRNPVLTISGTNRSVAIQLDNGGISANNRKESTFHRISLGSTQDSTTFNSLFAGGGISAGGSVRGGTGFFKDVILTQGLSAQDGAVEGYTGDFNNIIAHGGISANGLTLSHLAMPFLGLLASATGISSGIVSIKTGALDEVRISGSFGVSAGGNIVKGNTGEFNRVVAISGISCGGDIVLAEDAEVSIGGDTEKIVFDGTSNIIKINAARVQVPQYIQHLNDSTTNIQFISDGEIRAGIAGVTLAHGTGGILHLLAGVSANGISTDNIHVKSGISAGGLVKGNTGEFTDIISVNGLSAHAGLIKGKTGEFNELVAISGISCGGDILLPEDGVIQIGGDTEKIVFNGAGSGSSSIDIFTSMVDFGAGTGVKLRSHGDSGTYVQFENDSFGGGRDGLNIYADDTKWIDISSQQGVNFLDNEVIKPKFKDYSETVHAVGNVNSSTAFDFENGNVQTVTVAGIDTGSTITFSLSNPPASGIAGTMTVIFTNGNAHGDVAFDSSIKWPSDVAPSLTASGVDVISFLTTDGGTTYYGFVGGLNFS